MPGAGERAYAYAKACGIAGKSFIGRRSSALAQPGRLAELDRLVFPEGGRELPEKELLVDLESRLVSRAVSSIISVIESFRRPPEFLSLLLRSYEYADLKAAVIALTAPAGAGAKPEFTDLGRFGTVRFGAWPDVKAMVRDTEFGFLPELLPGPADSDEKREAAKNAAQTALDKHYYEALWRALGRLGAGDRREAEIILAEEIVLRNALWALRLRVYYGMAAAAVREHLIEIPGAGALGKRFAAGALACLDLPLDHREPWEGWPLEKFLNPGGADWKADPRYFQGAAARRLYRMARQAFRRRPSSLDAVFCFIKIKQFEEDVLTSLAEGLALGMTSREVFGLVGVEP